MSERDGERGPGPEERLHREHGAAGAAERQAGALATGQIEEGEPPGALSADELREIEERFDSEVRFPPARPPAELARRRAPVRALGLSLLHRRLRHPPRHEPHGAAPRRHPGADLPQLRRLRPRQRPRRPHRPPRPAALGLGAGDPRGRLGLLRRLDLRRPRLPRRRAPGAGRGDGHGPDRPAAGGDAPGDGLAAAGDRAAVHGLRAVRAGDAWRLRPSGGELDHLGQPPLPHQPGRLPAPRFWSSPPTSSTSCCSGCSPRGSASASSSSTWPARSPGASRAGRPRSRSCPRRCSARSRAPRSPTPSPPAP